VELHTLRIQAAPTHHLIEARDLELRGRTAQLNEAQSKLSSAQYRVEELAEELKQAGMTNSKLERVNKRVVQECAEAKAAAERAETALEPLHQQVDKLSADIVTLRAEGKALEEKLTAAEAARAGVQAALKKSETALQVALAEAGEVAAQLKEANAESVTASHSTQGFAAAESLSAVLISLCPCLFSLLPGTCSRQLSSNLCARITPSRRSAWWRMSKPRRASTRL